ncbi:MAG: hypothetical protein A2428_16570 [Bdellovibrionales bacterium RIFOXYC1_FULL_54_43]|nr:MAG: hypothetical protein A2428_16570 [Bdellovibrionales bacterium RIFOXYC1_FULL_54_43]OFZ82231.1 MAG: hypothetical protein A2603_00910 [Bdellovibrionales bacterium RIFOXYD1_FULL_55_31]
MAFKRFRGWTIFSKIMSLSIVSIVLSASVILIYVLPVVEEKLITEKRAAVQDLVNVALRILSDSQARVERGELDVTEAKRLAASNIRGLRYKHIDYIWINDLSSRMIMHPTIPSLNGLDLKSFKDASGKFLFQEFTEICESKGEGFVEYNWPVPDGTEPAPKLSFVKLFKPWGWILGSGIYVDDVKRDIRIVAARILTATAGFVILAIIVSFLLAQRISRPLRNAVGTLNEIAAGNLGVRIASSGTDETGQLLSAMKNMVENLRQSDEALRASRLRYQMLFERMLDGFALYTMIRDEGGVVRDYRFVEVNPAFERMIGLPKDELIGQTVQDAMPSDNNPYWVNLYEKAARSGGSTRFETYDRRRDRHYEVSAYSPAPGQFATIFTDISDRKRMESEKGKIQDQLFRASKLATIGTLAAGVAHEINNPLTIIDGNIGIIRDHLLEKGGAADDRVFDLLQKQEKGVRRIANIVNGLRSYARADNDTLQNTNLNKVITDTVLLVEEIYRKADIEVTTRLSSEPLFVRGNPGKLQQVLMNLVANAKDALCSRDGDRRITIVSAAVGETSVMEVIDNGEGISPKDIDHIFDPFYTTKPVGAGTGLGLALTYSIITSIGGKIEVESKPGQGSKFTVTLNGAVKDEKMVEEIMLPQAKPGKLEGRALLVDDEDGVRDIVRKYLETFGLEVTEAENGAVALEKLKSGIFDFVITDMKMPKMNGDVLVTEAKKLNLPKCVRYLVITGGLAGDNEADDDSGLRGEYGADGYLRKPFNRKDLLHALEKISELAPVSD